MVELAFRLDGQILTAAGSGAVSGVNPFVQAGNDGRVWTSFVPMVECGTNESNFNSGTAADQRFSNVGVVGETTIWASGNYITDGAGSGTVLTDLNVRLEGYFKRSTAGNAGSIYLFDIGAGSAILSSAITGGFGSNDYQLFSGANIASTLVNGQTYDIRTTTNTNLQCAAAWLKVSKSF